AICASCPNPVPNMGRDRDGICRSWGQYHFETFDGMYYYFPGKCSYILAKDCRQAEPQYTVWVHNSRDCEDSVYSCPRSLSLHFPNEEEIHIAGYHVHKGGVSLPQTIHNVFIERLADYILVKSTFGFSLAWDGSSGVYIKMTEEHKGRACGLCGNYNDDGSDDLTASYGRTNGPAATYPVIRRRIEAVAPQAARVTAVPTDNCEDSFVHRDCISCCPPTCTFEKECLGTNLHCLDGCYCPDGLILQNGTCIAVSQCPCVYHGRAYPLGHVLEQGCSACVCMGGVWNCTENNCTAECSITGHSHITSFDGRIFTHMGTCQYVLAKSRGNSKFVITLQNVPCGERQEHPCIHSVMLVVDEDINRQVTITREGEVLIGINQAASLPYADDTVEVRQLTSLFIQLRASFGLRVQLDGRGGRLYITLDSSWKGHTMGLCGTFNGNLRDDFLSPSGMIEGTPQLHANAWKVSSACISPVNVPIIDPCDLNQENGYYASLCTVLVEELFAPCHSYVSPSLYYQQCRFQACLCGGSCLCTALAHYAYVCAKHQVVINFRAHVSECGVVCLGGMMYHSCTTTCGRTCHSLSTGELCTSDCAEGCGCSENTFYDDIRQRCVLSLEIPHLTVTLKTLHCSGRLVRHNGECYFPENCPCSWLGLEYLPGQVVSTPCYTCVCHRGFFNCTYYPCPAVCTVYSDRHYHTFDGLEYDYVSNCQVYLVKSINETEISITTQNKDCYESGIICMKYLVVYVGLTKIYFSDSSGNSSTVVGKGYEFELWRAGYYTVVHFPKQEITVLWDKKTTVHIRAGPRWKDQLTGMCGNFDMVTINDMTTSSHMEVSNAQAFGDSWALGQVSENPSLKPWIRPCEGDLNRQPYAKRECALLYSDVFSPCHNVVDVTWFYKNCLTDTCNCNRGGDCECLCTSIAAYAHKCCQQGVTIHWRSPTVCCESRGGGPRDRTANARQLVEALTTTLPAVFLRRSIKLATLLPAGVPAVSLESAERPNYFLCVSVGFSVRLERWTSTEDFRQRATFIHHQGLWLPGHSSFELQGQKGVFLTLGRGGVSVQAYDHSERFKHISSFVLEGINLIPSFLIPYRIMCEWKYQACASPCLRTCSDPSATRCRFLPPVEGCFPRCPRNMILDEITRRCVYREDCEYSFCESSLCLVVAIDQWIITDKMYKSEYRMYKSRNLTVIFTIFVFFFFAGIVLPPTPTPYMFVTRSNRTTTVPTTTTTSEPTTVTEPQTTSVPTTTALPTSPVSTLLPSSSTPPTSSTSPTTSAVTERTSPPVLTTSAPPTTMVTSPAPETTSTTTARSSTPSLTPTTSAPSTTVPVTTPALTTLPTEGPTSTTVVPTTTPEHTTPLVTTQPPTTSTVRTTSAEPSPTTTTQATTAFPTTPPITPTTSVAPISTTLFTTPSPPQTMETSTATPHSTETEAPLTTTTVRPESTSSPAETTTEAVAAATTTAESSPTTEPVDMTTVLPPFLLPTAPCTVRATIPSRFNRGSSCQFVFSQPPFSHRVDECSEYICFNGQLMLHNASLHCRFNVTQPNCGLLGMAVQTNRDVCCPQWECPCKKLDFLITFDGNNVALYDNGSYILVHLPRENIVGHIEKCGTSGLCFKKLNITTHSYRIMINRLERKVTFPVLQNLHIDDTGTMYVIRTPGGVSIQWYHSTGIMVLQYNAPSNATSRTRGLCGCCDGNPADDLKLPNGTVVRDVQDIPVFLQSWMVDTSEETDYFRRVGDNCTTGNCTKCFQMLNRSPFSECHKKVSPEQFCDKIWAGDLHYKDNECDFLAAYVAICYTHNICINWRTHDFCPLKCPPGKEYQPCVNTCQTKTCQNREYYEESTCSSIREECVCKSGTILHRADSAFCVTEDQCVCTDNEGAPRAPGEVWNGSDRGCCLYRCLENGSIVAVEPDCSELPAPLCEREGEYVVDILEEGACCPKKICECNLTICESEAPTCENGNRLVIGYSTLSCCPEYRCECDPQACPSVLMPECREDQFLVEVRMEKSCCYSFLCVCESCIDPIPVCKDGEILAVDLNTTDRCCPQYHCGNTPLAFILSVPVIWPGVSNLSTHVLAEKAPVCLFQGVTVLSPGQSMVQYFEGDLCYTVHCLHEKDPETGYYAMDVSTVNCSEKCGPHQIYIPSSDPHVCCGSCKNVSCPHTSENGTTEVYMAGSSWVTNCTRYDCMETPVGAVILGSLVVCPPFNETECLQNGGVVQSYIDGCCRTCKEDGKTCKRVAIRTTIRKDDCRSSITVYSCDGKCPSATIFNFNINSHARFCKCCRENGLQSRTVQLYCTRNSTVVNYTFQEPMECSCQWN
uniref:Otogelin like n=1 Tax=Scleropages formosus TaxID=113540 RepID=A0A8C9V6N9_SCLFO